MNRVPTCSKIIISDNTIGPAGMEDGTWADASPLPAPTHRHEEYDRPTPPTARLSSSLPLDPSSEQHRRRESRLLLGGIHMVPYDPVGGNYTGPSFAGNVIDAKGPSSKWVLPWVVRTWSSCENDRKLRRHGSRTTPSRHPLWLWLRYKRRAQLDGAAQPNLRATRRGAR